MKKILVPVDFSQNTQTSCDFAGKIAQVTGAEIVLFHSFFEQIYFSDGGFSTGFESGILLTDDIILDFFRQKESKLQELCKEVEKKTGPGAAGRVSCIIESGDPQIQILHIIQKQKPDLVVMGSSGIGKKGFLRGSVGKRVMDSTDVPVMAIPDAKKFSRLKNILYVTDIEDKDVSALLGLFSLLEEFDTQIHCLHLDVGGDDRLAGAGMKALSMHTDLEKFSDRIHFEVVPCSDPKECLVNYVSKKHVDLIAFIPHKKNFFKIFSRQDLTKEDLFLTGLPILGIS